MTERREPGASGGTMGTVATALCVVGPLVAYIGIVPAMVGFALFGLGGLLGLVTLGVGIFTTIRHSFDAGRRALIFGGAVSVVFVAIALPGRSVPRINDITTDMIDPPRFVHAPSLPANQSRDMSYPGKSFADQQKTAYPQLAPLTTDIAPQDVFAAVVTAAGNVSDWEITRTDSAKRELEGVATSGVFRFQDDFIIQVRPAQGRPADDGGSVVPMRSKSRDGKSDIGANAARIESFFEALQAKL